MSEGKPLLNICAHMASGYFEWVMLKNAKETPFLSKIQCILYEIYDLYAT